MKEKIKINIEVKLPGKKQFAPHFLDARREFMIETTRGMLFRSLEAIERKLLRLYPELIETPHEQGNA